MGCQNKIKIKFILITNMLLKRKKNQGQIKNKNLFFIRYFFKKLIKEIFEIRNLINFKI